MPKARACRWVLPFTPARGFRVLKWEWGKQGLLTLRRRGGHCTYVPDNGVIIGEENGFIKSFFKSEYVQTLSN